MVMGPPALRAALLDCELGWLPTARLYRLDVEITTSFHGHPAAAHKVSFQLSKLTYQHEALKFMKGNRFTPWDDQRMRKETPGKCG
jgi:hypothetical protein